MYYTLRKEILVQIDTVTAGVKFVSVTSCTRRVDETCECEKVTSSSKLNFSSTVYVVY